MLYDDFQFRSLLGIASLRFLPKASSLRMILNMSRVQKIGNKKKCIQWMLQDLACVLSLYSPLSSSVMTSAHFHHRWRQLIKNYKNSSTKKLFFVKVDLQDCFDSICQKKMFHLVEKLLPSEKQYYIFK